MTTIKLRGWAEAETDRSARADERERERVTVELTPYAGLKLIHAIGDAWCMVGGPHEKDSRLTLRLEIDGGVSESDTKIMLHADGTWSITTDVVLDNL